MLVASAALGLSAPMATNAPWLNINGLSDYAARSSLDSLEQFNSITLFSDVYPTYWTIKH